MKNDPLLRNFEDDLPLRGVPAQDEIAGVTASSLQLPCSEADGCDRQLGVDITRSQWCAKPSLSNAAVSSRNTGLEPPIDQWRSYEGIRLGRTGYCLPGRIKIREDGVLRYALRERAGTITSRVITQNRAWALNSRPTEPAVVICRMPTNPGSSRWMAGLEEQIGC
jgi:hypothetical protein